VSQIYRQIPRLSINSLESVDAVSYVKLLPDHPRDEEFYPSWVPRWDRMVDSLILRGFGCSASGDEEASVSENTAEDILPLRGFSFDIITTLSTWSVFWYGNTLAVPRFPQPLWLDGNGNVSESYTKGEDFAAACSLL
jgi:hypothetical protein